LLRSSRRWRRLKPLLAFAAVQVLGFALAAIVALTWHGRWADAAPAKATLSAPALRLATLELDGLRAEATIGDLEAGRLLITQLIDNFERAGNTDDLYEAVQWMDRAWAAGFYQQTGLATRVFDRHCSQKVLRWHWLCDVGE
jgi:hypothetical protein